MKVTAILALVLVGMAVGFITAELVVKWTTLPPGTALRICTGLALMAAVGVWHVGDKVEPK